jgi:hypothetical protein
VPITEGEGLDHSVDAIVAEIEVSQRCILPQHSCKTVCPSIADLIASVVPAVVHVRVVPCASLLVLSFIWRDLRFVSFGKILVCARHALPSLAASADLLDSLVLLHSLRPVAAFCALLLTAGTDKSLRRFVLSTDAANGAPCTAWPGLAPSVSPCA